MTKIRNYKKMKKLVSLMLCLVLLASILTVGCVEVGAANNDDYDNYDIITSKDGLWLYSVEKSGEVTVYNYYGTETDVSIPEEIDGYTVNSVAMYGNSKTPPIKKLTIPKTCIYFWNIEHMKYLETIEFSRDYIYENEIKTFNNGFLELPSLKKVILPNYLPVKNHFRDATLEWHYTSVLPIYLFSGCTALEEVVFPNNMETICSNSFEECESLKYLEIPEGVKYVESAFGDNVSLTAVKIPSTILDYRECLSSIYYSHGKTQIITEYYNQEIEQIVKELNASLKENKYIIVEKPSVVIHGDINGDMKLNKADVDLLQAFLADELSYDISSKADINKDGIVDINDCAYLQLTINNQYIPPKEDSQNPSFVKQEIKRPTISKEGKENKINVKAFINGENVKEETYNTVLNKSVTIKFKLKSSQLVANMNGYFCYDKKALKLKTFEFSDKLNNTYINSLGYEHREYPFNKFDNSFIRFNSTDINNIANFAQDDVFLTVKFDFIGTSKNTYVALDFDKINTIDNNQLVELDKSEFDVKFSTPKKFKLSITNKTVKAGKWFPIKVIQTDTNRITNEPIVISSNNKSSVIAKKETTVVVEREGVGEEVKPCVGVLAINKGTATITVKVAGEKLKCKVKVTTTPQAYVKQNGKWVKLNSKKTYTVKKRKDSIGETYYEQLKLKITGKTLRIETKYTVSVKNFVRIYDGPIFQPKKKGKANITIKVNGFKIFKVKIKAK